MIEPVGLIGLVILVIAFFFYAVGKMKLFAWSNILATGLLLTHALITENIVFTISSMLILIFLVVGVWRRSDQLGKTFQKK